MSTTLHATEKMFVKLSDDYTHTIPKGLNIQKNLSPDFKLFCQFCFCAIKYFNISVSTNVIKNEIYETDILLSYYC